MKIVEKYCVDNISYAAAGISGIPFGEFFAAISLKCHNSDASDGGNCWRYFDRIASGVPDMLKAYQNL